MEPSDISDNYITDDDGNIEERIGEKRPPRRPKIIRSGQRVGPKKEYKMMRLYPGTNTNEFDENGHQFANIAEISVKEATMAQRRNIREKSS